jgi:hypothetical protein
LLPPEDEPVLAPFVEPAVMPPPDVVVDPFKPAVVAAAARFPGLAGLAFTDLRTTGAMGAGGSSCWKKPTWPAPVLNPPMLPVPLFTTPTLTALPAVGDADVATSAVANVDVEQAVVGPKLVSNGFGKNASETSVVVGVFDAEFSRLGGSAMPVSAIAPMPSSEPPESK